MSFIEKALEKTRLGANAAGVHVAGSRPSPAPRVAAEPAPLPRSPTRRIEVDLRALADARMLAPSDGQRRHAVQLRAVKHQLLKAVRKDSQPLNRIVMITSSLAGEGKTFSSVNLALSMAVEKDHRVLLVDGDVAKPGVTTLFGLGGAPGLLDTAHDLSLDVESLVVGTDLPSLDLLPAGGRSNHATESLASSRMGEVLAQLAAVPNRIVLIDSAPLLVTTEAAALAQHAGQVVIVVRANATPERAVLDSIAVLGERTGVSLLLNDVTSTGLDTLYYGYGQDYAYPYAEEGDGARTARAGHGRDA